VSTPFHRDPDLSGPSPARDPVARFVLEMARALHRFGCPAHRLEEVMKDLSGHLGTEGNFFSTPTSIMASFGPPDVARTHLIRVEPGLVDLAGQVELDHIIEDVLADRCTAERGVERIAELEARPPRYRFPFVVLSGALVSSAAAILFQGNVWDAAVSAVIGALIGALSRAARRYEPFSRVYEASGAFLATVIAMLAAYLFQRTNVFIDVLAGVLILLPGLTLTVSLQELATRNLASGTARLMGALVVLFQLGFGVAVAGKIVAQFLTVPLLASTPLPVETQLIAAMSAALGFMVLLSAPPREVLWVLAAAALALFASRQGAQQMGPEMGAFTGAFAVAVGSNLRARLLHRTAAVTMVPGVLMLVPGSIGFRTMSAFMERDVVSAVDTGFSMFFIGVSLVAGLLLANLLVAPRRSL
jgi:uncharacterized membrane protein YjjP (DUF1212 family)